MQRRAHGGGDSHESHVVALDAEADAVGEKRHDAVGAPEDAADRFGVVQFGVHAHEVVEGDAKRHGAVAELESVEGVDAREHEVLLHENAEVGLDVGTRVGKLLGRDAHVDELGLVLEPHDHVVHRAADAVLALEAAVFKKAHEPLERVVPGVVLVDEVLKDVLGHVLRAEGLVDAVHVDHGDGRDVEPRAHVFLKRIPEGHDAQFAAKVDDAEEDRIDAPTLGVLGEEAKPLGDVLHHLGVPQEPVGALVPDEDVADERLEVGAHHAVDDLVMKAHHRNAQRTVFEKERLHGGKPCCAALKCRFIENFNLTSGSERNRLENTLACFERHGVENVPETRIFLLKRRESPDPALVFRPPVTEAGGNRHIDSG